MFNQSDNSRNELMLDGKFEKEGYDWWWHSFTGIHERTGEEKTFFIEFFTCNPAFGQKEPVFGQLPANREVGIRPSYLMVKAGAWGRDKAQLHRFFGWGDVTVSETAPFYISADNCFLSETKTYGQVTVADRDAKRHPEWMSDAGSMIWNLKINKQVAYNVGYGASSPLRRMKAFEMYWHAEGMKTFFEGTVIYNGEPYRVEPLTCYGYADKNWGKDFTSPWIWLSSNHLTSRITGKKLRNSVFDIGGGRPKVFGVPLSGKLLGGVYYEGKEYEYNFSKMFSIPSATKFKCTETETEIVWHVWQENNTSLLKVDVTCRKEDMLLVNYEAPNGSKKHNRLWNGGTGVGRVRIYDKTDSGLVLVDDLVATHVGCEYGEYC